MDLQPMGSPQRNTKPEDSSELFSRSFSPLLSPISRTSVPFSDSPPSSFVTATTALATATSHEENTNYKYKSSLPFAQARVHKAPVSARSSPPAPASKGSSLSSHIRDTNTNDAKLKEQSDTTSNFLPPPAVTFFAYAPSKSLYEIQRNPLLPLQQQSQELVARLQELLNYQVAHLSLTDNNESVNRKGIVSPSSNARPSTAWDGGVGGTSVDTAYSSMEKQISLKAARKGILKAMQALAQVKAAEQNAYSAEESIRLRNIAEVEELEKNKRGLEEEERELSEGDNVRAIIELKKQKEDIECEIRQLESRLEALKLQHFKLLSQISSQESTITSRTMSCKNALSSLAAQQKKIFLALPTNLRNPSVALEHWKLEAQALRDKKRQAQNEYEALREGMIEWRNALLIINALEQTIQSTLQRATAPHATEKKRMIPGQGRKNVMATYPSSPSGKPPVNAQLARELQTFEALIPHSDDEAIEEDRDSGQSLSERILDTKHDGLAQDKESMQGKTRSNPEQAIFKEVEVAIGKLEERLHLAESKNWKLLICCISAELQALYEARQFLQLDISKQPPNKSVARACTPDEVELMFESISEKGAQLDLNSNLSNLAHSFTADMAARKSAAEGRKNSEGSNTGWGIDDIYFQDQHQPFPITNDEYASTPSNSRKRSSMKSKSEPMSFVGDGNEVDQRFGWDLKDLSIAAGVRKPWPGQQAQGQDDVDEGDDDDGSGTARGSMLHRVAGTTHTGASTRTEQGTEGKRGSERLGESLVLE